MDFFKNPLRVKYLPVLFALLAGVVMSALSGGAYPLLVMGMFALINIATADQPLGPISFWVYVAFGAVLVSMGIFGAVYKLWMTVLLNFVTAAFPISVVFTRKRA